MHLTRRAHCHVAPLEVGFVLTHRSAPDENVALETLHGAADGHHHPVDLHRDLPRGRQDEDLQEEGGVRHRFTSTQV